MPLLQFEQSDAPRSEQGNDVTMKQGDTPRVGQGTAPEAEHNDVPLEQRGAREHANKSGIEQDIVGIAANRPRRIVKAPDRLIYN